MGAQQGDVWGTWIYCMGIQSFFKELQAKRGNNGVALFFVDDSNFHCSPASMLDILNHIRSEGPKYGYHLNSSKGVYLIGKCSSIKEAHERFDSIVKLGFDPAIIRFHPDNTFSPLISSIHYGGKALGSFVGSHDYIAAQLQQKFSTILLLGDKLRNYPFFQDRYLLLRFCYSAKPTYLMRTTPSHLILPFLISFDEKRREILCSILNSPQISEKSWFQCKLKVSDSGLGLGFLPEIAPCAYAASIITSFHLLQRTFTTSTTSSSFLDLPFFLPLFELLPSLEHAIPNIAIHHLMTLPTSSSTMTLQGLLSESLLEPLLGEFFNPDPNDILYSTWVSSCRNDYSGAWLESIPYQSKFLFPNLEFQSALLTRLFLPQALIPPGCRCSCKEHPTIDIYGHHFSHGCREDGLRNNNHDELKREFLQLLTYSGFTVKVEEIGCFAAVDDTQKRPDVSILNWGPRLPLFRDPNLLPTLESQEYFLVFSPEIFLPILIWYYILIPLCCNTVTIKIPNIKFSLRLLG